MADIFMFHAIAMTKVTLATAERRIWNAINVSLILMTDVPHVHIMDFTKILIIGIISLSMTGGNK
jgi:hypothetical protein